MTANSAPGDAVARPLAGIRVLDLSRVLAGPWAAQMLADLGAEVIKIERPGVGDDARTYGDPYLKDATGAATRDNAFFLSANRGKQSVEADLATPQGRDVVRALALRSDVLVENFRVGALAKFGLDYASLAPDCPRLIYCSVTGFGQTGPYRARPGYDAIFQGMGGLMSVTGPKDGEPGAGPVKVGPSIVDILCGLFASNAMLAALHERARSGRGQHVDVALLDSVVAAMSHYAQIYLVSGEVPPRRGTEGNGGFPSQMLPCADGNIMLTAGNDRQFALLCAALGLPELAEDSRFSTNNQRVLNRAKLTPLLEARFRTQGVAHWLAVLDAAGVPAGPINDLAQVFDNEQVRARGMAVQLEHPAAGHISVVGNPIRYSRTPLQGGLSAPPMLGQHTQSVLREVLGYDTARIAAYEDALSAPGRGRDTL
jgi:crotonobetainyl-CoA:carnitine CoA-transferase CaiB-like acyl-CoA transferase